MKQTIFVKGTALICAVALLGCSDLFGPSGPEISVSLELRQPLGALPLLRADIGGRAVQLTATAAEPGGASREVRGPRYGQVPVRVTLTTPSGEQLAMVEFSQWFYRNSKHWVAAVVGQRHPMGHCIGTLAVAPILVGTPSGSGSGTDTLFVMYGSIPDDAIC